MRSKQLRGNGAIALLATLASLIAPSNAAASDIPLCKGEDYRHWTRCVGTSSGPNWHYTGPYIEGKWEGEGTLLFLNGDKYKGDFKAGRLHGSGEYTFKSGDLYSGQITEGELTGTGTLRYANGDTYVGAVRKGLPSGAGTYTTTAGSRYVGQFLDGHQYGVGIATLSNGNEYSGGFVKDAFEGEGTFTFSDGTRYKGQFRKGAFSGKGYLVYPSGDNYLGDFKDGSFSGEGTYTYADGTQYLGSFIDGFKIFHGAIRFPSGDSYVGELRDGVPFGEGLYLQADGGSELRVNSPAPDAPPTSPPPAKNAEPSSVPAHAPVLAELAKLREDWLRLAENKLSKDQELVYQQLRSEQQRIAEERAQLAAEARRLAEEVAKREEALTDDIALLERQRAEDEMRRGEIKLAEERLHRDEQLVVDRYTNERLKVEEERERLESERLRLESERVRLETEKKARPQIPVPIDDRRRVALVIGNAKYNGAPLKNPENDARAMAVVLRSAGFLVTEKYNLDLKEMREHIRHFAAGLHLADVALFYFAGHGAEFGGKNYLIPVNEEIESRDEFPSLALDADFALTKMTSSGSELNIIILDACRTNPYLGTRAPQGGLAFMQPAKGSLIAYATAPGRTAADGAGNNSPYTRHLVKAIMLKGLSMEQMFKEVRRSVSEETSDRQIPWEASSVIGDFFFSH